MESGFNNFLNECLRIFNRSFPPKKYYNKHPNQSWLTKGIKISCQHKRDLYMLCKNTNNIKIKIYYKTYCKTLTKIIKMAKRQCFNKLIKRSVNKSKTMWNLVKAETNTKVSNDKLPLTIKGKSMENYHELANVFNEYFIKLPTCNKLIHEYEAVIIYYNVVSQKYSIIKFMF